MIAIHTLILIFASCLLTADAADYLSPEYSAGTPDGKTLFVTCATSDSLLLFDTVHRKLSGEWILRCKPSGVAAVGDDTVYVTGGGIAGMLYKLGAQGKPVGEVATGHTSLSPVVSSDGATVYVLNRFDNSVVAVDAVKMKVIDTVSVVREPHAAALGADGRLLFVVNHLPFCSALNGAVASVVSVIDTQTFKCIKNIPLPNGSTGVRGIAASPDGSYMYVTHTLGRYQLPTTQLERGWMNTAGLSVLNGKTGDYVNTVLLDDLDQGAANPWGVAVSPDGKTLVVAHGGTREISVIDRMALHDRLDKALKNERVTATTHTAGDVPNDLAFLSGIRRRVKLAGDGPRGVVIAGACAYTCLYYSDSLAGVSLGNSKSSPFYLQLRQHPHPEKDPVRRGEMLWNDGSICFQEWQSCASCHPDGRTDGLNWDLLNDGIGNPKQTKSLVYCHLTPPTMVTAVRPDMEACNRKGLTHILFVVRPEEDARCIDAYVRSLKPVPSPYLVNGQLSKNAEKGAKLFVSAGCAICHPTDKRGPDGERLFSDLKKHNLGLGRDNESDRAFDTTTLVETWRTAPYLYDGRALTMEELLTTCNPKNMHGATKDLTKEEIKALAEYVLSL